MSTFILSAILLVLALIALEIYLILVQLARFPSAFKAGEGKGESPTINVNVGTGQAYEAKPEARPSPTPPTETPAPEALPPAAKPEESPLAEAPPLIEEVEPEPPPLKARFAAGKAATASGLIALRCPACQAENSAYRSECFNCGAPLS